MSQIQVVAAIIQQESKFLLGRRALSKKSAPGYWSPISGKIEPDESETDAIVRECFEEIGLSVQAYKKVADVEIDSGRTRLHWWLVSVLAGQAHLKNDEHTELGWFTLDEIATLKDMHPKDREVFLSVASTPPAE
jgi:8-oxo-dGTP pyrophosphatase MutT (NUDIX family)